jgi:N-acetylmuramoyl-L-alanine amidase
MKEEYWLTLIFFLHFLIGVCIGLSMDEPTFYVNTRTEESTVVETSVVVADKPKAKVQNKQVLCMAANIFAEARGEGKEGMKAVAAVTANRVLSGKYPNTVCEVVKQPKQFSWTMDNSMLYLLNGPPVDLDEQDYLAYQFAYKIAQQPIKELTFALPKGILHYTHKNIKNKWTKKMRIVHRWGNHVFYKGTYASK